MITIRHEQLEALRRPTSLPFEQRLCDALAHGHPEEVAALGPEGTRALVRQGLRTGWRCGLEDEDELARLVTLMLQLGPDFERSPDRERALARLHHPRLPGRLKIDMVEQLLTARTGGRVVVAHARVLP
ncbi:MAG: hypothetical protein H6712_15305 [Myxococcales bacterium]|nr:hypothetical protein [Myxococcales bacterium]MCB9715233.1 hypothetical protein [Myxococcales bacterium]